MIENDNQSPIIGISELTISLGGKKILRDVSFDVGRGEFLCIVGKNGAGKSTLFKCLCGVYKNFEGELRLAGRPTDAMRARERARIVAYVPQSAPPDMPYTAGEFMEMSRYAWRNGWSGSKSSDERAIASAVALAGTGEFSSRRMCDLSGGERQKVMIASAIASESDAILMDEPTTFLDYAHQVETMEMMSRVNRERGVAMLVVTHDVNIAIRMSGRVVAIAGGRVEWSGAPDELREPARLRSIFGVAFEQYFPVLGDAPPLLAPVGF
ncbi:MAG: ABC transporter ATP-binding protein [Synergistaceae bacterium]|jgi:iron complex transport system ATP-binding protein|nr:ABC transporter ATP-binding protein [Synergistaceae bacterium]